MFWVVSSFYYYSVIYQGDTSLSIFYFIHEGCFYRDVRHAPQPPENRRDGDQMYQTTERSTTERGCLTLKALTIYCLYKMGDQHG